MVKVVRYGWAVGMLLLSFNVASQSEELQTEVALSAHEVVRDVTQRVMVVVAEAPEYVDDDPERYNLAIHEVLDPVIDFRGFARSVMGPYASGDRYRSLDEPGRQQLRGQLEQFTEVMRIGLVTTYGKGLLAFGGSRIEINEPSVEELKQSRVSVSQLIYSEESQPYVLMYQMGRNKEGQWKLRNVIIETVNLGEIYKNQFQASARKYDGDLDRVIENWASTEAES